MLGKRGVCRWGFSGDMDGGCVVTVTPWGRAELGKHEWHGYP